MNFRSYGWTDSQESGLGNEIISANLSPFGGLLDRAENTYDFLIDGQNLFDPTLLLIKFLEAYGFNVAYAERIKALFVHHLLRGKRGYRNLFHFLIPKSRLNDFVYVSKEFGYPDKGQEDAARYFHMYRTNPFDLSKSSVQQLQARIVLLPDLYEHVTLVNHNLISEKHKREFKQDGENLLDQMFDEWWKSGNFGRLASSNLPLYKFLQAAKRTQEEREIHVQRVMRPAQRRKPVARPIQKQQQRLPGQ